LIGAYAEYEEKTSGGNMNHTTLIKNEKDHAEALTRVSELIDKNPVSGSEEGDEL
jgi:hypothetical protein